MNFFKYTYRAMILVSLMTSVGISSIFAQNRVFDNSNDINNDNRFVVDYNSFASIRRVPSLDGQASTGEISKIDDWYKVDNISNELFLNEDFLDDGFLPYSGYNENLIIDDGDKYVIVNSYNGVNLRTEPSDDSTILDTLTNGQVADYIGSQGEWAKVSYNDKVGFLNSNYVYIESSENYVNSSNSELADEIIAYGKQFLGTPYVYGGTNLNSGVDCSGFVYSVMKHFNIYLPRVSSQQANNGFRVQKSNLQKGDLVFFDTNGGTNRGNISHVGIYIGDGQFIHSSSSVKGWGVSISSLNEDYYIRTYVTATRIL